MNKNTGKGSKVKKNTFANCESKNDEKSKGDMILKKKQSKRDNLNGLVNGLVNNAQDGTKGTERNVKDISENDHNLEHIIQNNHENSYNKSKPQTEESSQNKNVCSKDLPKNKTKKSLLTKLDSNDNIPSHPKVSELSQESDVSSSLSNTRTIVDLEDSIACCSNKISSSDKIAKISKDLKNIELEHFKEELPAIKYVQYESEQQMPMIMKIIQKDLSEPYSIYTYRYFIHNWPKLCFLAMCADDCVGAIVCKLDLHRKITKRGYIAMLAVDQNYRKLGIGSTLVRMAIQEMIVGNADEVVLETEVTNKPALQLYEALGFVRDKRLFRYYLNGVDALRLKLWLR